MTRTLEELRAEIDSIDDSMHDLVMRRALVTGDIARAKANTTPNPNPNGSENAAPPLALRPAREAAVLRRLAEQHHGPMPVHTMVCLWRSLMSASLQSQTPFILHAYAPTEDAGRVEGKLDLGDLAHAYFGGLTRLHAHKHISHVVHACAEDRYSLGVVPMPEDERGASSPWWSHLAAAGQDGPRVVARLPFVTGDDLAERAYVIGPVEQEDSGDDTTLILLEANTGVSRNRLQALCKAAGLEGAIAAMSHSDKKDQPVYALAEIDGFVAAKDPRLTQLRKSVDAIARAVPVGGFANPLVARGGARR